MRDNNTIYSEIYKLFNYIPNGSKEYESCFEWKEIDKLDEESFIKMLNLLMELDDNNDTYAPYYLYRISKFKNLKDIDKNLYLSKAVSRGSFRACLDYIHFVLSKSYGLNNKEREDNLNKFDTLNHDKFYPLAIKSRDDNDIYYQNDSNEVDSYINFYEDKKIYERLKDKDPLSLDEAKEFVNIRYPMSGFILEDQSLKDKYINTLRFLVDNKEYDYLVDLVNYEPTCQQTSTYGSGWRTPKLNTLKYLSTGCLKGSLRCMINYYDHLLDLLSDYDYSKRSVKDRDIDTKVYKNLHDYFYQRYNNVIFTDECNDYLRYLVNDYSIITNQANYIEAYEILMRMDNADHNALMKYEKDVSVFPLSYQLAYAFANEVGIKDRDKCKNCISLCVEYYENDGIELTKTSLKALCFVKEEPNGRFIEFDSNVLNRYNLLVNHKYDDFLNLIQW